MKHTCCWVLKPFAPGQVAQYCGKPVSFKMIHDDDNNLIRKYNSYCDEHYAKLKAIQEKETSDDS